MTGRRAERLSAWIKERLNDPELEVDNRKRTTCDRHWERNCPTPPGCGHFNGATEYALSRGIQSQIDCCIYIGSSSGGLSSTEIRPEYLKPR